MSKSLKQCSIKSNKIPPKKSTRLRHVNTSSAVKRRSTALLLSSGALKVAYRRPVLDTNSSNFMTSLSFAVVWYILRNRFKNVFVGTPEIFIQTYVCGCFFSMGPRACLSSAKPRHQGSTTFGCRKSKSPTATKSDCLKVKSFTKASASIQVHCGLSWLIWIERVMP